jgi:hypothetical protein
MSKLKEITEHSWLVISDTNSNIGLLSEKPSSDLSLLAHNGKARFKNRKEVCDFFGKDVFAEVVRPAEMSKENYVNGYLADFHSPYPVENETHSDLPFYTKTESGTVIHCAGYYVIHFPKGPIHSFCPKYSTLSKYEFEGPFKTELEMKTVLSQIKKNSRGSI